VKLIGISGISGSGKTYFINRMKKEVGEHKISVLSFDNYYKALNFQQKDEKGITNFDLPSGVDHLKLLEDISLLKSGREVMLPIYNFNNPISEPKTEIILPKPLLLVEGIFVFHFQELFRQLDLKIYLESNLELTLQRRLMRDAKERGIEVENVLYQWHNHVLPSYQKFLEPHKNKSDIVVSNHQEGFEKQVPKIKDLILSLTNK